MPSPARNWRSLIGLRDGFRCGSETHDPRCTPFRGIECHHIVYRAHLAQPALWLPENGVLLSDYCHDLAHRTHNGSLSEARCRIAVDAVNLVSPREFQRGYFERKPIARRRGDSPAAELLRNIRP